MHDLLMIDGDLVPNWAGGLAEGDDVAIDYQDIDFRVRTNDPGFDGANLEDLIGQPNTAATGTAGEASILRSLTFDRRFTPSALTIDSVPLSDSEIGFFIGLTSPSKIQSTVPFFRTVLQLNS